MCTGTATLVRGVMAASRAAGSMLSEASTSTMTGVAPVWITASQVATNVKQGRMTSSPGPTPKALRPVSRAAVHEDTAWA